MKDIIFLIKNRVEFWNHVKSRDFFGLKVKYVVWIIPIPILLWVFVLVGNLLLCLNVL